MEVFILITLIFSLLTISTEAGAADRFCCNYLDAKFGSCCCRTENGNQMKLPKKIISNIVGLIGAPAGPVGSLFVSTSFEAYLLAMTGIICLDKADCDFGWRC